MNIKENYLKRPIIFIGSGRTGTTIYSDIIFRHKDLGFPSNYQEMFPKLSSINLIRKLFDNKFWRIFGNRTYNRKYFNLNNYTFRPTEGYSMWEYITGSDVNFSEGFLYKTKPSDKKRDEIRSYFEKMLKFQNKKRLAFKITGPSRIEYLTSIFPDAIFIDIRRNFIPTISSFLKQDFWIEKGQNELKWEGVYTDEEKNWVINNKGKHSLITAFQLKKIREITNEEVKRISPIYLKVTYEELMENSLKTIKKIFDLTGLKEDRDCLDFINKIKTRNKTKFDTDYFTQSEINEINKVL